ncbi:MAG: LTA synthase family protein [Planctomycetes bacterium]|nr:LTA synthase family protein [Planctomycetota bacterium]
MIVILEESFGSEFVGVLGHGVLGKAERVLTPHFDRWAREGLLLTQLVPTGNRTVRGLEGVLASFVPLPGDAILRRKKSEDVATLARVFRARGFHTAFLYGGRMLFDGMSTFLAHNGWEEMIENSDYPSDAFTTAWGAADEYVFDALLARQEAARAQGEKLFATLLTVSNHKPYDVPLQDEHVASVRKGRGRAVAYADFCIGRYLERARAAGLLEETLVLIVGDHGARVYGSADIPAASYRVPALFLSPEPAWHGQTIERLCSQIDLAPTLLSLAGIAVEAPFFGQDLLGLPPEGGRAFLQHNRDVGILTDTELVVLGLQKSSAFYARSGKASDDFRRLEEHEVTAAQRELALDAAAVFQTAQELYDTRSYRLGESSVAVGARL